MVCECAARTAVPAFLKEGMPACHDEGGVTHCCCEVVSGRDAVWSAGAGQGFVIMLRMLATEGSACFGTRL